jgi:hypothetical protein
LGSPETRWCGFLFNNIAHYPIFINAMSPSKLPFTSWTIDRDAPEMQTSPELDFFIPLVPASEESEEEFTTDPSTSGYD